MKKSIITLALVFITIAAVSAQPRAIGARLTYSASVSYQHYVGDKGFIQADLDFPWFRGIGVTGTYNWIIAQPAWTSAGSWDFYAGVGLGAGGHFFGLGYGGFGIGYAGVAGNVGLSYTFDIPLQIAIEERVILGAQFWRGYAGFYYDPWPALAIRYSF